MTQAGRVVLVALAIATLSSQAIAGWRGAHGTGRPVVIVTPGAHPGDGWRLDDGPGHYAAPVVFGRAVRTTVYPYGPGGDAVRGYVYRPTIGIGCGCGPGWYASCR
ncbi:MAG: hypothetical protein HZA68_00955 [Rhodovulum sp.]|nr:hypothetical protein [Rhodovulum sp.]